jgi:4-alpha-glucanotransferase
MPFPRSSGLLLHPTSLPGPHGIGDLGADAYRWIEFLERAGQRLWQVMPLGPTGYGDSPYQSFSAFAGNPYLLSLTRLADEGWLDAGDLTSVTFPDAFVDYGAVIAFRLGRLTQAAARFRERADDGALEAFAAYCRREADWLDDYAVFMALKEAAGGRSWHEWDPPLRDREPVALAAAAERHADAVQRHKLWQHWFETQWLAVKAYANEHGVRVVGDVPIFVAFDSADTWAGREHYHLADDGTPTVVAGVPPDYFSATGQRWGNPLYRWGTLAEDGFDWWVRRLRSTLRFVDLLRIDHFRGFAAYWEIPATEPTAVRGRWVKGPGQGFFDAVRAALGELPIIAEDLGVITPDVEALRDDNFLPGMKVLQFAFAGGPDDPYLPHNYPRNAVVYTGTHDNDTTTGWYAQAPEPERDFLRRYLSRPDERIAWELWRAASASVADLAVAPLQDVLGLGSEARMNTPGVAHGNWTWRFTWEMLPPHLAPQLREMAELYGRVGGQGAVDTAYRQSVTEQEPEEERGS